MNNPCNECPYNLSEESKQNLCSNPDNNVCKYWLRYQGYLEGKGEGQQERNLS